MTENILTISGFLRAMQNRFEARANLVPDQALQCAVATLDGWECVFKELVELTEECAHEIVDSELEHWESE